MKRQLLRATSLAFAGLLVFATAASAAQAPSTLTTTGTGMVLTVGPATLATKAAVHVSVSFTCDPLDNYGTPVTALVVDQATVTITQAVGKAIATGSGDFAGNVTCDSSTLNTFDALVVASTVPFSTGTGIVSTWVTAFDWNDCCSVDRAHVQGAIRIGH